jgi:hypothetical protein
MGHLRSNTHKYGWDLLAALRSRQEVPAPNNVPASAEYIDTASKADQPPVKFNRRRLQMVIFGVLTVAAVAYGIWLLKPAYQDFYDNFTEKWAWKVDGWDNEQVRNRDTEMCVGSCKPDRQSGLFPQEELAQCENLCSRPGWDGMKAPGPWVPRIAFLGANWLTILEYSIAAVLMGPWLFAVLTVRVLPTLGTGIARWLKAPGARR